MYYANSMLIGNVIFGTILMAIGTVFTIYGIGGRTIAKLIPLGILARILRRIYVSIPSGVALIVIGTWFLATAF